MHLKQILVTGMTVIGLTWTLLGQTGQAQTDQTQGNNVYPAELSVPFGIVPGTLVTSSDYLIFIDNQQPGGSFSIPKNDAGAFRIEGDRVTIDLKNPVRDRVGERRTLTFRMTDATRTESLNAWMRALPANVARGEADRSGSDQATTYQVLHKHMIGECSGRLIISGDRLSFESVTDLNHSRQWSLRDVSELKRQNPYELEVRPFVGNSYNFELLSQGMDSDAYRVLVDRIATLRTAKP